VKLSDRLDAGTAAGAAAPADQSPTTPRRSRRAPLAAVRPEDAPKPARRAAAGGGAAWDAARATVRDAVLEELAPRVGTFHGDDLLREVRTVVDRVASSEHVQIPTAERRRFVEELVDDILGYGPLEPLLADPSISEVMCNAHDDIWIERAGRLEHTDVTFADESRYRAVIQRIVGSVGRRVDESSPMVDARLPDGSRVNVIVPPLAVRGSVLTIRKFAADPMQAKDLVAIGTWTMELAVLLEAAVRAKVNILVTGGSGTGKTTNLNVLSSFIPEGERVVTIEDAAELQLQQSHVVTLESRPPNAEGAGEVRIRDLVRNALRMRPDRIVVGEIRGGEALDMLQAMNTGHEGSMTTLHANTPRDALSRLETMVLMAGYDLPTRAIREQIVSAIQLIMHLDRMPDGRRVVTAISELHGLEGDTILLQDLYRREQVPGDPSKGELRSTGLRPRLLDRFAERGVELPAPTAATARRPQVEARTGRPRR
jgi:pilus assembly protein CpaF